MEREKYRVRLATQEKGHPMGSIRAGKGSAQAIARARVLLKILLKIDEGWTAPQEAAALEVPERPVCCTKRRYAEGGPEEGLRGLRHDNQVNQPRKAGFASRVPATYPAPSRGDRCPQFGSGTLTWLPVRFPGPTSDRHPRGNGNTGWGRLFGRWKGFQRFGVGSHNHARIDVTRLAAREGDAKGDNQFIIKLLGGEETW